MEFVIVMPVLLATLWMVLQLALWQHAKHVALAAAQDGARAAQAHDSSAAAGRARATAMLDRLGGSVLLGRRVEVRRGPTAATVAVSGHATSLIPWLHLAVDERSSGPVERFVPAP